MANPNIVNVTTIYGNSSVDSLTTVTGNTLTNSSGSNNVIKLNSVTVANYSSSNITANVMINRSSVPYFLAGNISVPSNSTLVVVGKDTGIYMIEGDVLQANVSANSSAHIIASYETIN